MEQNGLFQIKMFKYFQIRFQSMVIHKFRLTVKQAEN